VSCAPLEGWCRGNPLEVEGRPIVPGQPAQVAAIRRASVDYFSMMGIDVQAGRAFQPSDVGGPPVVVINRALAEIYFPDGDAVGRSLREHGSPEWTTVVGVVDNTATTTITEEQQAPIFYNLDDVNQAEPHMHLVRTYVVRAAASSPLGLVPSVRAVLRALDPELALADVHSMERVVSDSGARISFALVLLVIAAITALLLGAIGVYGVISYSVTRRTGEIGIRLALGARPAAVVRMILREGSLATGIGLILGLLAALGFGRFMRAILFGVEPTDPATYLAVAASLASLALLAAWIPARRAASLDPVSALRTD
jgi:predicted permease